MQEKETAQFVEAIKLAAGGVQYKDLSVKQTLVDAVKQLDDYYESSKDMDYLEVAVLYIQAYLEMGFVYEENKAIFGEVLNKLGTSRELKFPRKFYAARQIKLNKSQVRSMIGKWPSSPKQELRIDEVINDIIAKVKDKDIGIFYYHCAVTDDCYELVINEKETFFHDLRRGIFYTFVVA